MESAINTVRECLGCVKPDTDFSSLSTNKPLLKERVITSFEVLDLILHLERASGSRITRDQLVPGSFRDIETIARVFILGAPR